MGVRIAVVQMNSAADVATNLVGARQSIEDAAADGAELVVLPENFAAMGADDGFRVTLAEPDGSGPIQDFLAERSATLGVWIVGGTMPIVAPDAARPTATCFVFDNAGSRRGRYDKIHMFDVEVPGGAERYRESDNTSPGKRALRIDTPWGGLAVAVCYDLRFPEMFRYLADDGFSMLAVPAAFTQATGQAHWDLLLRARAVENLCVVAAAAQTGSHPGGRQTYGHSAIVGPWGDVLAECTHGPGFVTADFDGEELQSLRDRFPSLQHRRFGVTEPR